MLTICYMPNASSVLHLHPTLVPLVFPMFPLLIPGSFYLLVSPFFFTCCQHVFIKLRVRKRANCLIPHQCIIFGTSICFCLLNSYLDKLTRYVGSTGYVLQLVSSMTSCESSRCSTYSNVGDWIGKHEPIEQK